MIKSARIVTYTDDTVIYVANKDMTVSKTKLSKDMDSLADWFNENGF